MKLYWGSGSPPCVRVIITMIEKGLWNKNNEEMLSFSKKEHKSDRMLELNPRGQVPTFTDGDLVICESVAICLHLEEKYVTSESRLIPTDPQLRAQVYQAMFEEPNISTNVVRSYIMYVLTRKPEELVQKDLDEKAVAMDKELKIWDNKLKGKSYLVGDKFTMADVFFYPDVGFLVRLGLNLKEAGYPNLQKYYDLLQQRPSIKDSEPPHWKEEPSKNPLKGFTVPQAQESAK